jgi:hypothetical protein
MRKHPLLALFTTTITLTTAGAIPRHATTHVHETRPPVTRARLDTFVFEDEHPESVPAELPPAARQPAAVPAEVAGMLIGAIDEIDLRATRPHPLAPPTPSLLARSQLLTTLPTGLEPRVDALARLLVHARRLLAAATVPASRARVAASSSASGSPWLALRYCESGDNYGADTGNGYYGAYQFTASTWWWIGYAGMPDQASPAMQDQAARVLEARVGWGAWPVCSQALGLH